MSDIVADLRYALRSLRRQPAFTAAVVLTLALGIGAAVGMFQIVNGLLLQALPYQAPDRLVRIYGDDAFGRMRGNVSPMDVVDWRAQARSLQGIATLTSSTMTLTGAEAPDVLRVGVASANFFDVLGVSPALGRAFLPGEDVVGQHHVLVLAYDTWLGRFGGDPDILDRTVTLTGNAYRIVGVLPPDFRDPRGGAAPAAWRPLALALTPEARGGHWLQSIARLTDGASLREAQAEMDAIMTRLEQAYPATNTDVRVALVSLPDATSASVRRPLLVLLAAVGLLLAIACVNVANLAMVRAGARARELGVRAALGAGRDALVRQLLLEHGLLALAGAVLGVAVAQGLHRGVTALAGDLLPRLADARVDLTVVAFAVGLAGLSLVAFGLMPALGAARVNLRDALLEGGRGATGGVRRAHARAVLAGTQLVLSFVLLTGAGLLAKSFARLAAVDPGFVRQGVLTFSVALNGPRYDGADAVRAFHRDLAAGLAGLPGVRAVGFVDRFPLSGSHSCDSFGLGDRPRPPIGEEPCAEARVATPEYFTALGIPVLAGRGLAASDDQTAPRVVAINAAMARHYWPGGDPVGKSFSWGDAGPDAVWRTIVGVVGDVRHFGLNEAVQPEVYVPAGQSPATFATYAVRTTGRPEALVPAVRRVVAGLDAELPLRSPRALRDVIGASVAEPRLRTVLLTAFAMLAVLLAGIGVYGVLAYGVGQRTGEFGIRVALGARVGQILGLVLRGGFALTGIAIGVGYLVSLWVMPALSQLLYGVSPADPTVAAGVAAFLLAVATAAALIPARRAARVDPLEALRHE